MDISFLIGWLKKPWEFFLDWLCAKNTRKIDHDIQVFKKLDAIASEQKIGDILNSSIYCSRFTIEEHHLIEDFIDFLNRIENRFLDSQLKDHSKELAEDMSQLLGFVLETFSHAHHFLSFHPDQIDPKRYDEDWKKLNQEIENAWTTYKTFRLAIKERLQI